MVAQKGQSMIIKGKFGQNRSGLETVEDEYASPGRAKQGLKKSPSGDSSLLESDFDEDDYVEPP